MIEITPLYDAGHEILVQGGTGTPIEVQPPIQLPIEIHAPDAGGALAAWAAAEAARTSAEAAAAAAEAYVDQVTGKSTLNFEFSLAGYNSMYAPLLNQ